MDQGPKEWHYEGNIYLRPDPSGRDACIVTTNGIIKRNGLAVMGAGIARYCRDTFHGVDRILGEKLRGGNHCYLLSNYEIPCGAPGPSRTFALYSFPTKHDWRDDSDISLIRQSCREMVRLVYEDGIQTVYMPCPGCACGRLDYYQDVRPILMEELNEHFVICIPDRIWWKGHAR